MSNLEKLNKLDELLHNEYDAMAGMDIPMPDTFTRAMNFIKTKITHEEFMDIESAIYSGCINSEYKAFEQGFMRGIVIAKGGVI